MIQAYDNVSSAHGRRLFWDGCVNVRDLGGFRTRDGRRTRQGALVRMDNPGTLSAGGLRAMLDYGVTTVIDLRYPIEIAQFPHLASMLVTAEKDQTGAPVIMTMPLLDEINRAEEDSAFARSRDEWHEIVLDSRGRTIAEVLRAIAHAKTGAVAFHCAVGKDRTGVISALILDTVGVTHDEIASDYALSAECLQPRAVQWLASMDEAQRPHLRGLMRTAPEYILHALNHLDRRYGGTQNYLHHIGLSDADTQALRTRLVE